MKIVEVEDKPKRSAVSAPQEPKFIKVIREKLYLPPPRRTSRRQKQTIGLFSIWSVVFWTFFISSHTEANIPEFLFYYGLLSILIINTILFMQKRETDEMKEETRLDIIKSLPAFALWGGLIFGLNFFLIVGSGNKLAVPSTFEVLRQLIVVVPCESLIFIVYLPPILDWGIASKIPLVPGWIYAQVLFGMLHVFSGAMPLSLGIFAVMIGIVWYIIYSMRKMPKYGRYFGLAAVMAWHFSHNVVAESVADVVADPLIMLFKLMGL